MSVAELIRGERLPQEEHTPALAEQARELLVYSRREVRRTTSRSRGMALLIAAACLLAVLLAAIRRAIPRLLDVVRRTSRRE